MTNKFNIGQTVTIHPSGIWADGFREAIEGHQGVIEKHNDKGFYKVVFTDAKTIFGDLVTFHFFRQEELAPLELGQLKAVLATLTDRIKDFPCGEPNHKAIKEHMCMIERQIHFIT